MRIVGGVWRGRALAGVGRGDPAAHLRPTSDRVREALFNVLEGGRFGAPVAGAAVLDLFAGTGALALEALSRGAATAVLIDKGAAAARLAADNIARCGAEDRATFLRRDATRPGQAEAAASLVFLDPPYGKRLGERAMAAALAGGWIAPGALIVWEEAGEPRLPEGVAPLETRRYGGTALTFARREV
ncbi:16S rRNA (guanine(966)-N(2))-methyltransferase RsmD [Rhodobacteraceae bacterium CCMM004]|nr:16S rRNA (guanine(966)-N(2))-methyltransferase RsmD [Rhodobacteraceae bacterium CCMM004]